MYTRCACIREHVYALCVYVNIYTRIFVCQSVCLCVSVCVSGLEDGNVGMKARETRELCVYACTRVSLCVGVYVPVSLCMSVVRKIAEGVSRLVRLLSC